MSVPDRHSLQAELVVAWCDGSRLRRVLVLGNSAGFQLACGSTAFRVCWTGEHVYATVISEVIPRACGWARYLDDMRQTCQVAAMLHGGSFEKELPHSTRCAMHSMSRSFRVHIQAA